ncbi:MAG: ABC transporter permease [Burkholderiaceae bacterium]|jgi:ABC-2 type transport system permease protein|nr:ABC transporter permease [Burkholderiaceae bacterium]
MTALLQSLLRIAFLWRKEFLAILKDPSSRVILVAPVIMQSIVFGYVATYDLRDVPYALLDQSGGGAARELVARFDGTGVFRRVATLRSEADIAPAIERQGALVALHIGPRFEVQLQAGESAPLQVILDARNSNTAGSAARFVTSVVSDFNRDWRASHGGPPAPLSVETRAWFNPNLETRWYILPGLIAGISMLQTLLLTALSVSREREQGTFDQLLVTPLTPLEIMAGKALPPVVIGLVQATLVLLVARLWFHIPLAGALPTLYAGLALFTLACVGIGLSVSALSATMQQATLYSFVLVMPMMLLSGLATPISNMPRALQIATLANPLRFAVNLVQRVYLEGVGLADIWGQLVPMLLIAAITLPLASWLFRHKLT